MSVLMWNLNNILDLKFHLYFEIRLEEKKTFYGNV